MDTFETLVSLHLRLSPCTYAPPPFLASLLARVVKQPLWMRNTLLLIHRFFSAAFKTNGLTSGLAIEWLLSAGFPLIDITSNQPMLPLSYKRAFALACTLIVTSQDVALAQSVNHLSFLFGL